MYVYSYRLAEEALPITDGDLTVEPHRGHLIEALEAERVELEHGAAVLGVLKDDHCVV